MRFKSILAFVVLGACGGDPVEPIQPLPALSDYVGTFTLRTIEGAQLPWILYPGSTASGIEVQSGVLIIKADSTFEYTQVDGSQSLGLGGPFTFKTTVYTGRWTTPTGYSVSLSGAKSWAIQVRPDTVTWMDAAIALGGANAGKTLAPRYVLTH